MPKRKNIYKRTKTMLVSTSCTVIEQICEECNNQVCAIREAALLEADNALLRFLIEGFKSYSNITNFVDSNNPTESETSVGYEVHLSSEGYREYLVERNVITKRIVRILK